MPEGSLSKRLVLVFVVLAVVTTSMIAVATDHGTKVITGDGAHKPYIDADVSI